MSLGATGSLCKANLHGNFRTCATGSDKMSNVSFHVLYFFHSIVALYIQKGEYYTILNSKNYLYLHPKRMNWRHTNVNRLFAIHFLLCVVFRCNWISWLQVRECFKIHFCYIKQYPNPFCIANKSCQDLFSSVTCVDAELFVLCCPNRHGLPLSTLLPLTRRIPGIAANSHLMIIL